MKYKIKLTDGTMATFDTLEARNRALALIKFAQLFK